MSLRVYDVAGRLVRTLASGDRRAGVHEVLWSGENDRGDRVSGGMYFYALEVEGRRSASRRMLLVR